MRTHVAQGHTVFLFRFTKGVKRFRMTVQAVAKRNLTDVVLLRHRRRLCHVTLFCILVLIQAACTSKTAKVQDIDTPVPFPEVRKIVFHGNTHFRSGALRSVMATKQRPLIPPWKRGESYNLSTLKADLQRLKKFYFDHGFLDTVVRLGEVHEDTEKDTISITIIIEEGPPTRVTSVRLGGTLPPELPAEQALLAELQLQPQQHITKAAFDQSKEHLLTRLQNAGYARAQIVPRTEVDTQAHTAAITFTVVPAPQTTFGRVSIVGAKQVREQAIQRRLTIRQGQTYSAKTLAESANAVYGLGMFQAVTPRARNLEALDEPLDIDIDVRERKPRNLRLGFGFSSIDRFRLLAEWTHRNLFGSAQRLTVAAKIASFVQELEGQLHFPYFLRRRMTLTQTLYVRNEQEINTDPLGLADALFNVEDPQPNYDLLSIGGETRVGYQFTRVLSGSAGLQLSWNEFSNVESSDLSKAEKESFEDNILLIQFIELLRNTSDNRLNPTRGTLLRGRFDHSTQSLVSDVSFIKLELEARYYRLLWWRMILATRLLVGGIQPYGGSDDVPINVRFFAGGPGSVRGFAINRLGPLDSDDDPLGGKSLIEGSVELRFPILGKIGGALFVDFGNVFRDSFTYRLDDLRYAVGPGIRYDTPIGPVRLDVGIILDRRADEDFGRVEFSIGQAF
jgi:outer membrane protein assembly complex protein YaeT